MIVKFVVLTLAFNICFAAEALAAVENLQETGAELGADAVAAIREEMKSAVEALSDIDVSKLQKAAGVVS